MLESYFRAVGWASCGRYAGNFEIYLKIIRYPSPSLLNHNIFAVSYLGQETCTHFDVDTLTRARISQRLRLCYLNAQIFAKWRWEAILNDMCIHYLLFFHRNLIELCTTCEAEFHSRLYKFRDRAVVSKVVGLRDFVASILGGGPFWVRYSCVSWLRHRVIGEVFNWR